MIKKIIILLCIICLFVNNGIAATYTSAGLASIGQYQAPDGFTGNTDGLFLIGDVKELKRMDSTLSSTSTEINNLPDYVDDACADSDYVYVILRNGVAYRLEHKLGLVDFDDYIFSGDDTNAWALGDFSTAATTEYNKISYDSIGNIYIFSASSKKISKIDGNTLASVDYYQFDTSEVTMVSGKDHFLVFNASNTTHFKLGYVDEISEYVDILTISETPNIRSSGIAQLNNDNYVVCQVSDSSTDYTNIYEYNQTAKIGTVSSTTTSTYMTEYTQDMIVLNNGIVVFLDNAANYIYTYASVSGSSGYIPISAIDDNASVSSIVDYTDYNLYAEYNEYFNNSKVTANWLVQINKSEFYFNQDTKGLIELYDWKIELYTPSNILASSYTIPDSSFKWTDTYLYIFASGDMLSVGSINYPNLNINGTWTISLYETNTITGDKALLVSDQFIILNEDNTIIDDDVTPTNEETNVYDFIFSKYFIGIIGFIAIAKAIGTDKLGKINNNGIIIGCVIAAIVLVLTGIFPMWIIFVIVLFGLILLGKKLSDGGQ